MIKNRINIKVLLAVSVIFLLFINVITYWMLLSKNEEWKTALSEGKKSDIDVFNVADVLMEHVYYDGDSIPCNQIVRHYSRSGKIIGKEYLGDVLHGNKVVLLLSSNCCPTCAQSELKKLRELSIKIGRGYLVIISDFDIHEYPSWGMYFDEEGYYETDMEHLGLMGSPTRETPVLMLTQDGRVKTSFAAGNLTDGFVEGFHNYLVEYFKGRK